MLDEKIAVDYLRVWKPHLLVKKEGLLNTNVRDVLLLPLLLQLRFLPQRFPLLLLMTRLMLDSMTSHLKRSLLSLVGGGRNLSKTSVALTRGCSCTLTW